MVNWEIKDCAEFWVLDLWSYMLKISGEREERQEKIYIWTLLNTNGEIMLYKVLYIFKSRECKM